MGTKPDPLAARRARRRLSDREVVDARRLHADEGLPYTEIGRQFGVSPHTIAKICRFERRVIGPVIG